uniref:NADH dehydrogenase subunit 2 n=1 Tax=Synodus poeyi TaxID=1226406 RepID=UPI0028D7C61B|nr:NADH dehydrogenase subunit 2 [Synodus poeyi]WMY89656.1 NADH dehydrogenase subunit 2 [Synodus poeyi]
MSPSVLTVLISSLGLGTAITLSSSHWLLAWMGLEMNTLAILPVMSKNYHPRAVEATTKYFITQATAAAMILFASTTNAWITGQWDIQYLSSPAPVVMTTLALALKLGMAPVHFWLPEVLQGLDLITGLILSTWQKIAPLALLLQLHDLTPTMTLSMGLMSMLIGGWGGLNQTQLRKILAYSSIAHLGWMMIIVSFTPHLTLLAMILYIIMTTSVFATLLINGTTTINSLATSWPMNPLITALFPLLVLSLGGLPPLSGFMPKWLILQELANQHLAPAATIAALSALISLYFYLRMSYAMTLTTSPATISSKTPWRINNISPALLIAPATSATIMLLPLTPSINALFN